MVTPPVIEIKSEPLNQFISTLFHEENPSEIQNGIEIKLNQKEVDVILDQWFEEEKQTYKLQRFNLEGYFLSINYDSQKPDITTPTYDKFIKPTLEKLNYSEQAICELDIYLRDLYTNARVFGSLAGKPDDYDKRKMNSPPQSEIEYNRKKRIHAEVLITEKYILCKVSDTGNGIDETAYREKMKKSDEELERRANLPFEEQLELLFTSHRAGKGLQIIEIETKNPLIFKKSPASTSFLKYAA